MDFIRLIVMTSLTPAYDEKDLIRKKEAFELCGKNRGPHDYMPIEWLKSATSERVTRLMCRVCFSHVSMKWILERYADVSY
jgi:hypothetical protein